MCFTLYILPVIISNDLAGIMNLTVKNVPVLSQQTRSWIYDLPSLIYIGPEKRVKDERAAYPFRSD